MYLIMQNQKKEESPTKFSKRGKKREVTFFRGVAILQKKTKI